MVLATSFIVHAGSLGLESGLSLRGACDSPAAAQKLQKAVNEVIDHGLPCIWVDCQRLHSLGPHGQRALYHAHQQAEQADAIIYWCGLPPEVQQQLSESGLHLLLHLLPAASYRGPAVLLQDTLPALRHTRLFTA